jgi:hypothetical protein
MTFEERVDWAIRNRAHLKSRRNWCRLAKLSEKNLSAAVQRSKENEENDPRFESDSANRLCEVAQIDRTWFESGVGAPDLSYAGIENYDTHAMRREAALLLEEADKMDPKEAWWLMRDLEVAPAEKVTWRTYYTAARALAATGSTASATPVKPQLSAGRVALASASLRRKGR